MTDFLRTNQWCTREEYMWVMTVAQVRLSSLDFSHVEYVKDKKKPKKHKVKGAEDLKSFNDLGAQIRTKEQ